MSDRNRVYVELGERGAEALHEIAHDTGASAADIVNVAVELSSSARGLVQRAWS